MDKLIHEAIRLFGCARIEVYDKDGNQLYRADFNIQPKATEEEKRKSRSLRLSSIKSKMTLD